MLSPEVARHRIVRGSGHGRRRARPEGGVGDIQLTNFFRTSFRIFRQKSFNSNRQSFQANPSSVSSVNNDSDD
jgi:hypothetical protein